MKIAIFLSLCLVGVILAIEHEDVVNEEPFFPEVRERNGLRIVGGTEANWRDNYPYLLKNVCLYPGETVWEVCGCTSTLIGFRWAVTAAHCLNGPYTYRVGVMFSTGEVIEILAGTPGNEIRHPNYSRDAEGTKFTIGIVSDSVNDVGLQRLSKLVIPGPGKRIFDLLYLFFNPDLLDGNLVGLEGKLLGWGATQQEQVFVTAGPTRFSNVLNQIDEIVQNNAACQAVLDAIALSLGLTGGSPFRFSDGLVCATPVGLVLGVIPEAHPAGLCNGDSGGPLLAYRNYGWITRLEILGFVTDTLSISVELPCGNGVDIYTRFTPEIVNWIQSVIL